MISKETIRGGFPVKNLGDIAEFLDSQRRPITASDRLPGPYPYYGANGQQDSVADYIFDEPLVLLAEDGGLFDQPDRGIAYAIEGKTWVNNHAHVLRARNGVHQEYLVRVLENYDVTPWITGSTRAKLTKAGASKIQIPLPPLVEQKRIARILDAADALRAKRRESLAQLDTLLQSTFLDMFGDPVTNPMGWPVLLITDAVDGKNGIKAGPFGSALKKEDYTDSGFRIYGQEQVIAGRFDIGDYYIDEQKFKKLKSCSVALGDILVSLVGSYGKVLIVPDGIEPGIINPRLLKISPRQELVTSLFLATLIQNEATQRKLDSMSHGGTMGILNAGLLKQLMIPTPPLDRQWRFAAIVESIDQQKASQRAHLAELDTLFASLQSRAFRGDL